MELPKNITQIGEADHRCKIYVEDYVISYMKQLNQVAQDKEMAVALYGIQREENEVSYLFVYGAGKLTFLQKETRHLSQAQQQEIEKIRGQYFREYTFLGYRLLNGEMIEGFHICEQGICRYISGYAQFYEKNDSMLAYMLDVREEVQPEVVDQEKYNVVKNRQEIRRNQHEEEKHKKVETEGKPSSLRGMKVAVVGVFALLCIIGLTSLNEDGTLGELREMAKQAMSDAMEQRIPDAESESDEGIQPDTLIAEDKLAQAVLQENEVTPSIEQVAAPGIATAPDESEETEQPEESMNASVEEENEVLEETSENTEPVEQLPATEVEADAEPQPVSYIIKEGDTLIGISVRNYGNDTRVSEICALNQIENPDDIKIGQKILLP